jgi:hypothetical protein
MTSYRLISDKQLSDMLNRGWSLRSVKPTQSVEEVIAEKQKYYSKIKAYQTTTAVRGYYSYVVVCKN